MTGKTALGLEWDRQMERKLELLEGFLSELNHYCDAAEQTERWFENMRGQLQQEQDGKRALNEAEIRKQQVSCKAIREKSAQERNELQEQIRNHIVKKKTLLARNLAANTRTRDQILALRNQITRPEYFQYAYRYGEYGDFYPKITKLDDFKTLNLQNMVDCINYGSSGIWMNKIRGLFRSEDMMTEYASFANLLGKARYLCEVENDALKENAQREILQLERELEEAEESFMKQASDMAKKQQKIQHDNEAFDKTFMLTCEKEQNHLREDYRNRQMKNYETLRNTLRETYPTERMKEAYEAFAATQASGRAYICDDGIPLTVKLGQLWFHGSEALKNTYVKQLLEKDYGFMIAEGRLSIPGIA